MPPTLIADAAGASPQLAFWRDNFVAAPNRPDATRCRPPDPTDPVFLALYPPPAVAARIRSLAWGLRREHRLRGWPVARECLHVSLHGICRHAELTPAALDGDWRGLRELSPCPRFWSGFGHAASFALERQPRAGAARHRRDRGAFAPCHAELGDALRRIGLPYVRRAIQPHVTLLYDPRAVDEPIQEIRWTVREFMLVCGLRGRGRHLPLARWRLQGGPRC